jgi:hypothetical protein
VPILKIRMAARIYWVPKEADWKRESFQELLQFYYSLQFATGSHTRREVLPPHRRSFKQMRIILVPGGGVEPPRPEGRRILSPPVS